MLSPEKITRINELSRKSKSEGLNDEEKHEQAELRQEYIRSLRQSFTNTLHSISIVDQQGNDVTPDKLKEAKQNEGKIRPLQ